MSEVTLLIDGTEHRGWSAVSIRRSLEEVAASFELTLSDRFSAEDAPFRLVPFQAASVLIDGAPVIEGLIDTAAPSYDAGAHSVTVSGRSLTGQLVDCSAEITGGEAAGLSLGEVANIAAAQLGVRVIDLAAASAPFARVQVEQGESVHELLDRLARQRGVFLTDDAQGRLVIRRRSTRSQGTLKGGFNVLSASAELSGAGQFSDYTIKGQTQGSDLWGGEASAAPVARARDASVPIHRPKVLLPETQGDAAALQDRATFEAAIRRGRSRRWTYAVSRWRRDDGALWQAAEEVTVVDPVMGLDDQLLVVAVAFVIDERGTRTELTLAQPEGYDLRAVPETQVETAGW